MYPTVGSVQGDTHLAGRACAGALLIVALADASPRRCGWAPASAATLPGLADGDLLGLFVLRFRDADLHDPVLVGRGDVGLCHALRQRQRPGKRPVAHLPAQVALLLPLFLLAAFGLDVQHPVRDGQLHVLVRVDAGQIGAHHQRAVLLVFLDPDQVPGLQPAREPRGAERHHPQPLLEQPVEAAEHVGCLSARLPPHQTCHGPHLPTVRQCRGPAGPVGTLVTEPGPWSLAVPARLRGALP